jgi:ribosomal protein S12 methylthiotransferase
MHSVNEDELIAEAKRLVDSGVKELNLIAQDSSRYGYDLDGQLHLSPLLKKLNALEGVKWIRVLYLYPDEIPDDLIETMKSCEHILPYFDIPVQHGNNRILKEMHRRGSRELIIERCARIRNELPQAVLRTTLITGFPTETEEEHQDTLSLISACRFDHLGAFTYSSEEDTPAYEMEDDVPEEVKQRRLSEIMALQAEISAELLNERVGQIDEVMVESYDDLSDMYVGRSALFAPDGVDGCVRFRASKNLKPGDFACVKYTRAAGHNLIGVLSE